MERKIMEMMDQKLSERDQIIQEQQTKILQLTQSIAAINLQNQRTQAARESGEGSSRKMTSATRLTEVEEDDLIVQLRNLKQVSHIRSYIEAFSTLNSKAGIQEDQALSIFLSGLLDEIRIPVCLFKPETLDEAYALSKLQELTLTGVLWCDHEKNLRRNEKLDVNSKVEGLKYEFDESSEFADMIETDKEVSEGLSSGLDEGGDGPVDFGNSLKFFLQDMEAGKRLNHDKMKETELGPHVTDFSEYNTFSQENKLKEAECVPSVRQNAAVRELTVGLPISAGYSLSLSWLLNWFPRPTVKLKFVAQSADELYEEWGSHESHEERKLQPISSITDLQSYKLSSYQKSASYRAVENSDAELERIVVPPRFIVDEADRMLDMGIEPEARSILSQTCSVRQMVMFSTTWSPAGHQLAQEFMDPNPVKVVVGSEDLAATHDVIQIVEVLDERAHDEGLQNLLEKYHKSRKNRVLVFVLYKKEASRVESMLHKRGWKAVSISGDKAQSARTQALSQFKDGSCPLLIATDVAAQGLDISDVEVVINYSFPLTTEDYVHSTFALEELLQFQTKQASKHFGKVEEMASSSIYRSLKRLPVRDPKPLVKMKFMVVLVDGCRVVKRGGMVVVTHMHVHGEVTCGILGMQFGLDEERLSSRESLETEEMEVNGTDIGWLVSVLFPKPSVKMKVWEDKTREAWLHDSLWTRNLKGEGLLRSYVEDTKAREKRASCTMPSCATPSCTMPSCATPKSATPSCTMPNCATPKSTMPSCMATPKIGS